MLAHVRLHKTPKSPQLQSRLHLVQRVDLALEAVEAYEVPFRLPHRARVLEEAHPGFPLLDERIYR